jgi:putative ABC transport system ATP-binding protein
MESIAQAPSLLERGDSVIRLRGLEKAYVRGQMRTPVLLGIDLDVKRGESIFLAGPSGCGKSTLLSILGCILTADRGEVRILGHDLLAMTEEERTGLRRHRIGFIFQRFQLVRGVSARDNVSIPLRIQGVDAQEAVERADAMLAEVGLADKRHSRPHQLSGGQAQRVAIARALVASPELILADEPTASLDEENGAQIMELFRDLVRRQGKTAVMVTHDQRVFRYADRVLHLSHGRIDAPPVPLEPELPCHAPPVAEPLSSILPADAPSYPLDNDP